MIMIMSDYDDNDISIATTVNNHNNIDYISMIALYVVAITVNKKFIRSNNKIIMIVITLLSITVLYSRNNVTAIYTATIWPYVTLCISQFWPRIINTIIPLSSSSSSSSHKQRQRQLFINGLIHGGPLGYGCTKLIEVCVATCLWLLFRKQLPNTLQSNFIIPKGIIFSSSSSLSLFLLIGIIVIFSITVNGVLYLWSKIVSSKVNNDHNTKHHKGLQNIVKSTIGRKLSYQEHCKLLFLAFINAFAEETTSRAFWRNEFEITCNLPSHSIQSNIAQAILFGIWHYYGIPNGIIGVMLTFIYGILMGLLSDSFGTNLLVPIITHTIADYYIFAYLIRQ